MIIKSTPTTDRLEKFVRLYDRRYGIAHVKNNASGLYFVVNIDGHALTSWLALGWSFNEARQNLKERFTIEESQQ